MIIAACFIVLGIMWKMERRWQKRQDKLRLDKLKARMEATNRYWDEKDATRDSLAQKVRYGPTGLEKNDK